MKLNLYQKNIMLKIIKNKKINSEIKILFLIELLYYNAISAKIAKDLLRQYIWGIPKEAEEKMIKLLEEIPEQNITLYDIKNILAQEVFTTKMQDIESQAELVYMMYDKKGITFLSVLISMALIVLIVYISMSFFPRVIHNNAYIRDKTTALYLAQETMEQIESQSYNSIISQSETPISGFTNFYKQIDVTNLTNNGKIITVTVNFPEGKVSLSTERYFSPYER